MPLAKLTLLLVMLVLCTAPADSAERGNDETIALLNGEPITQSEVERRVAFQIYRLRGNIYQLLKRETEKIVEQKLLEMEARRRNMTVENLLRIEVDEKAEPVSEDELKQYLLKHSKEDDVTEQRKARIRTYLARRSAIQREKEYIQSLRSKAELKFLLTPPQPPRVKVEIHGEPWRGSPQAPVTVVHFAAFNCELCPQSVRMIQTLLRDYPDRIRWVHRNFFSIGDEIALTAAQLGEAAQEKGRFWEFHDAVFNSDKPLDRSELQKIAQKLDLEWESFESGQFESDVLLKVKKDVHDAQQYGVTSVPVMFVNGLYFSPTFPYARLKAMVTEEINRAADTAQTQSQTTLPSSNP
ncbi:MAG: thioredoxin domain-containing protein [Desulfobacterales bacterium]|nr:MAG: thioredoxin domain-containing protein [Desulfobacterales bacterium]